MTFRRLTAFIAFVLMLFTSLMSRAETVHLYAGAGLRLPVEEIVALFQTNTGHTVTVEYGGSGQILTRFQLTNEGDLFLPGSADYVEKLNAQQKVGDIYPLVRHTAVMVVRRDKAGNIVDWAGLATSSLRLGMGDPKAIALGVSGEKILELSGYGEQLSSKVIVRAATIKQLLMYILNGDVDAGVIGRSDAVKNSDVLMMLPTPIGVPEEEVTLAILKTSRAPETAKQLARYFISAQGVKTFTDHGFLPLIRNK